MKNKNTALSKLSKKEIFKYIILFFLTGCVLLLLYTFYKSEVISQGSIRDYYLKYYLISILGILFWGIVLRLNDKIKLKLIMAVISMIVGLYVMEIVLFLVNPDYINMSLRQKHAFGRGAEFDRRNKFEVVSDFAEKGVDAVPRIVPSLFIKTNGIPESENPLLPLGGVSGKKTVLCNETDEYIIYQSDRYGFGNPDAVWDSDKFDLVLTGDSFTHGYCVQSEDNIAGQIRRISGKTIVNLGAAGNGPLSELAALKEYAEKLKPAIVLWVYFEGNDLRRDLKRDSTSLILYNYIKDDFTQDLFNRQEEIDLRLTYWVRGKIAEKLKETREEAERNREETRNKGIGKTASRILRLEYLRQRINFNQKEIAEPEVTLSDLFYKIMTKAGERVNGWGGKFYFVYLPEYHRYADGPVDHNSYGKRSELLAFLEKINIPVIDIHEQVFIKHPDPVGLFPYRKDGHYTTEGYNLVSEAIVKRLMKDGLL